MRRASKILMPAFLRLQNAQIAECSCGVPLVRAVIWQSFMFIASPNLIRIKTIRVPAKKAAVKQAKETIKKTAKKEVAFTHF